MALTKFLSRLVRLDRRPGPPPPVADVSELTTDGDLVNMFSSELPPPLLMPPMPSELAQLLGSTQAVEPEDPEG